ncbi:DUF2207 domain-containing protein [Marinobacter salsuginis]|uniref:DUF2207 domain-containing protein n=1 Tax=Marinobacter salsuginis TaxID=418719 RepID=UPI0010AAE9EF|nr:DUF2207 domain-containing protein [Marinobacter salsuginis]
MLQKLKRYQNAGVMTIIATLLGLFTLAAFPGEDGETIGSLFLIIASSCAWFFCKGRFGSAEGKEWVERNF